MTRNSRRIQRKIRSICYRNDIGKFFFSVKEARNKMTLLHEYTKHEWNKHEWDTYVEIEYIIKNFIPFIIGSI